MYIKKGDTVLIIRGDDKGRKGKVLKVMPKQETILVQGINVHKKHQKPKKEGEKGQVIEKPAPIHISKIKLLCPKCRKATRVSHQLEPKIKQGSGSIKVSEKQPSKVRICKKCGQII